MLNPALPRVAARARAPRDARRARRGLRGLLVSGAVLATLAAPAMASAAANPLTFDYNNSTAITAYANPTGAVVVGRNFFNPALVDQIQAGGGEVYQYVDVIDGWWTTWTATGDQAALYGGAKQNPDWLWSPRRSNWPNTYMTDMRPGSPWILHAVEHITKWFPTTHAKGLFLDVVGERLWTSSWDAMSAGEKAEWAAGNRDFVHRLRVALGPDVILVANNSWANGNPELNGLTIEHHSYSEASNWSRMTGRSDWFAPTRNMVIANSVGEGRSWANVPGVTHVSAQATYGAPAAPILPFSLLPGTSGTIPVPDLAPAPAPPPATTPVPEPAPIPVIPPTTGGAVLSGNLLPNPSFEGGTSGWSSWQGTLSNLTYSGAPDGLKAAQTRFGGSGASFTVGDFPGRVTTSAAGAKYTARAWVRAAASSSVGKPVTFYMRERSSAGTTLQQVRGVTKILTSGFQTVTANITTKTKGSRIDVFVVQDRAASGNAFQVDAISMAPQP